MQWMVLPGNWCWAIEFSLAFIDPAPNMSKSQEIHCLCCMGNLFYVLVYAGARFILHTGDEDESVKLVFLEAFKPFWASVPQVGFEGSIQVSGDPSLRPKVWVGAGLGLDLREGRVGPSPETFIDPVSVTYCHRNHTGNTEGHLLGGK